ncbi:MAG: trypsin-like peptidase domain-containing protein, partial [Bacteroidetes bacterium]|nr:trypsin-like peptidase domain-containing protein [Bacteroidota bacterium]
NAIHQEIDVHAIEEQVAVRPSWIVQLWRDHHSKISVAASIAIFAILATLFVTGSLSNKSTYEELVRKVNQIQYAQNHPHRYASSTTTPAPVVASDRYRATGFAITSGGLIATNYHVVEKADSVYVQNFAGKSFKAKVLYTDENSDIAILKVTDSSFKNLGPVPYTFKRSESDLAENVFTYGYPQDQGVYGDGRITSQFGLNGDSVDYQVSVPINPGNSGGPLFDSKGNIIGIVKARQTQMEGAHFASKANYLLAAIDSLTADSLTKHPVVLNTKNTLAGLSRQQQIKKLQNYVFLVKVYAKN